MIRKMRNIHIPIISRIYKSANPHATVREIMNWTTKNLHMAEGVFLIFEKDHKMIGGVSSYIMNDVGYIDDIAVRRNLRRKGYGSKLLYRCISKLKEKGVKRVKVDVHYKCASAIPFYYSQGFKMTGIRKDRFGKGQDCIMMEKKI
jgi:ribosomal protein S18 acetylase RimI-like enzyme